MGDDESVNADDFGGQDDLHIKYNSYGIIDIVTVLTHRIECQHNRFYVLTHLL